MDPLISKHLGLSRRGLLLGAVPATFALAACTPESAPLKKIGKADSSAEASPSAAASNSTSSKSDPKRWGHYGDSLTITGIPEALEEITGITNIDAGVAGNTSLQAAMRAGGVPITVTLADNRIPGDEVVEVVDMKPAWLTVSNDWEHKVAIAGVPGYMITESATDKTLFYRDKAGDPVEILPDESLQLDPFGPTNIQTESTKMGYSLIIGLGRNDITNQLTKEGLVENINKIVDASIAADPSFLVWDIPKWASETNGTAASEIVDEWNNFLAQSFPDNFVPVIDLLISNIEEAFEAAGLEISQVDIDEAGTGIVPISLCEDHLGGHLNAKGCKAWAHFMAKEMKSRGFI